jgi:hypothetical protein
LVRNFELDRLMSGLPFDVDVAPADKNKHRDAFSSRGPQHLKRDLEFGNASDRRSKTGFRNG